VAAQLLTPGAQPPFDGRERERKELGDAEGRPLLIVEQIENVLNLLRQVGQHRAHCRPFLLAKHLFQWARLVRRALSRRQAFQFGGFRRLAAALARRHPPRAMAGDSAQPACELRRVLELMQRPERQQKRFLGHILGCLPRTERLLGHQENRAAKPAHQLIAGFQAAHPRNINEFRIADKLETALHRHASGSSYLY